MEPRHRGFKNTLPYKNDLGVDERKLPNYDKFILSKQIIK